MNVAKPGGAASPGPVSPEGGAGPVTPPAAGAPDRRFADVLASGGGGPSGRPLALASAEPIPQPFKAPILDDNPVAGAGVPSISRGSLSLETLPGVQNLQRVAAPVRTLEVRGERVQGSPAPIATDGAGPGGATWQRLAEETFRSESRIDSLIKAAQGGKAFNASELMALQIEVFRYSQTVEVIGRTTDKLVGAVKQTLGTQV